MKLLTFLAILPHNVIHESYMQQLTKEGLIVDQILDKWPEEFINREDGCLKLNMHKLTNSELSYLVHHVNGNKTIKRSGTGLLIVIKP